MQLAVNAENKRSGAKSSSKQTDKVQTNAVQAGTKSSDAKSSDVKTQDNSGKNGGKQKKKPKKKRNLWSVKITVISLFLSAFFSFISEMTASSEHMIVTILLLLFLILASILFDGIGVAATSCEATPIVSMASKKVYGAKTALWLVKNNEKVSNVCNDVIGDIFGIISGACTAAIVAKLVIVAGEGWQKWLAIILSSVVAALTIGGKAFLKNIAINNSRELVMLVARVLAVFSPEERRRYKKQMEKKKTYAARATAENADVKANSDNSALSDSSKSKKKNKDKDAAASCVATEEKERRQGK